MRFSTPTLSVFLLLLLQDGVSVAADSSSSDYNSHNNSNGLRGIGGQQQQRDRNLASGVGACLEADPMGGPGMNCVSGVTQFNCGSNPKNQYLGDGSSCNEQVACTIPTTCGGTICAPKQLVDCLYMGGVFINGQTSTIQTTCPI